MPAAPGRPLSAWVFQLRRATGELAHVAVVMDGQTVKVKNLAPAIYIGCLSGLAGRESCASMDLNPPKGGNAARITQRLTAPDASSRAADEHVVSTAALAVPPDAYMQGMLAQKAQLEGNDRQAQAHLERALQIHPDYPEALNNLGSCYYRLSRFDESIELLTKATTLEPGFFAAWINLSGSLVAVMRFDLALDAAQRALDLRPNDAMANSRAGLVYYYMREYERAATYFRKSRDLDPASASTPQLFLAHIALGQNRREEAGRYLREYLEVHPNAPDAAKQRMKLRSIEAGIGSVTAALRGE